ncbi:MAG: hydrogen gas-evolving membrane-bound hydrogenase subunit E [Acidimicrobiia bacterium]|nr:hydrogen gas-evolving membrane-bound hydrogenase subunit E [Acidimicrobiia bacterium]
MRRRGHERVGPGIVQNGSLPIYLAVVLLTAIALPLGVLLTRPGDGPELAPVGSWTQPVVAALVVVGAVGVAVARRRLVAVILLGAVGAGVAVLFVITRSTDLALHPVPGGVGAGRPALVFISPLPKHFQRTQWNVVRSLRVVVSLAVGLFVATFAAFVGPLDPSKEVSEAYLEQSLSEGEGRNVVNVILTIPEAFNTSARSSF